jgi:hypothetical protein
LLVALEGKGLLASPDFDQPEFYEAIGTTTEYRTAFYKGPPFVVGAARSGAERRDGKRAE